MSGRAIGFLEGVSAVLTGGGVLMFALFPLAIPLIALTAVALIPFLVVGLALAAVATPPVLLVRWLRRRAGGARPREGAEARTAASGRATAAAVAELS